jgi:N-acetylated-alpha-linked acidic dipeptidase
MTLRMANAEVLPFEVSNFVETVGSYVDELRTLIDGMRTETVETNQLIDEGLLAAAADPTETSVLPTRHDPVPHLNFAPLENAIARLERADTALSIARPDRSGLSQKQRSELDVLFLQLERKLTRDEGLPGRPWYKHQIYAPGQYTGYGVKTLPAVREAIELRRWQEADQQIEVVAKTLERFAAEVERAAAVAK